MKGEKYGTSTQASDDGIVRRRRHAISFLGDGRQGYRHTSIIFPLQQWLRDHTSMLHYTYIVFGVTGSRIILRDAVLTTEDH
jgi:hypothetical protein